MQDRTLEVMSKINQGIQIVCSVSKWDERGIIKETAEMIVDNAEAFDIEQDFSFIRHWFVYAQSEDLKIKLLNQVIKILPFKKCIIFCNNRRPIFKVTEDLALSRCSYVDLTRPYHREMPTSN